MAHDEGLAVRLTDAYAHIAGALEKKMFGGLAIMVNGHMSCGVNKDKLMVRVGPEQYEELLKLPHAQEMDFTGKPLRGFIYVSPEGIESDEELNWWVQRSLDFVLSLPPK